MAEKTITRVGDLVDIRSYLDEKDSDGNLKNVSADIHALFANATEEKDENGRVTRLVGNGVAAYVADAALNDDKKNVKYVQEYVGLEALTIVGASTLVDGRVDVQEIEEGKKRAPGSVCSYFSQAFGQTFRNSATATLRTAIEGPEKSLDKAVELIAKARKISYAEARKLVYGE